MRAPTLIESARTALAEALAADERVAVLGEDVAAGGPFGLTKGLAGRFGTARVRNTPISEGAVMGAAVGLALAGGRPVVDLMFLDFVTAASDQLVNHAAKVRFTSGGRRSVPLTVWTVAGGGTRWGAQHSQRLDGWLVQTPGLKVLAPATPAAAAAALAAAIADPDPVVVIADRDLLYGRVALPGDGGSPWRPRRVREGADVTVVATGRLVHLACAAADDAGVDADVVDLQRLAPLDVDLVVASLERTSRLVVCHDEAAPGGVASLVVRAAVERAFWHLDTPPRVVAAAPTPVPAGPELEDAHRVDRARIARVLAEVA